MAKLFISYAKSDRMHALSLAQNKIPQCIEHLLTVSLYPLSSALYPKAKLITFYCNFCGYRGLVVANNPKRKATMKSLVCFVPILALILASCSSPNNTTVVNNTAAPKITGFSPDTVWTLKQLTVYGSHFGFDSADLNVTIGGVRTGIANAEDTVLMLDVADSAQTGFIRVATINGSATSAKTVTVEHSFNPHHIVVDTIFEGASFSIPGTGMKNYHGFIVLRVGGLAFPIDSIFDNRIVSHVIPAASSNLVTISDALETYDCGYLYVTRPTVWNTLSVIWDHITLRETHNRTGYINGPTVRIDSSWVDTATYSGQHDINVSRVPFIKAGETLEYLLDTPYLYIYWDTLAQTASVTFRMPESISPPSPTLMFDTSWGYNSISTSSTAFLPVDRDIEFTFSGFGFSTNLTYQIVEDSADEAGLVNWQETTAVRALSGNFDLIFKH